MSKDIFNNWNLVIIIVTAGNILHLLSDSAPHKIQNVLSISDQRSAGLSHFHTTDVFFTSVQLHWYLDIICMEHPHYIQFKVLSKTCSECIWEPLQSGLSEKNHNSTNKNSWGKKSLKPNKQKAKSHYNQYLEGWERRDRNSQAQNLLFPI